MDFYLVASSETISKILDLYIMESCKCVFENEDVIIVKCKSDFVTCAKIDQQFCLNAEIYHSNNKWPDMNNVSIDKSDRSVTLVKDKLIVETTIYDNNVDEAEEEAMLLLQAMIETEELLSDNSPLSSNNENCN